jgi:hypothetical protein
MFTCTLSFTCPDYEYVPHCSRKLNVLLRQSNMFSLASPWLWESDPLTCKEKLDKLQYPNFLLPNHMVKAKITGINYKKQIYCMYVE